MSIAISRIRYRRASTFCTSRSRSDHRWHLSSLERSWAVLNAVVTFDEGFGCTLSIEILAGNMMIATIGTSQDSISIVK